MKRNLVFTIILALTFAACAKPYSKIPDKKKESSILTVKLPDEEKNKEQLIDELSQIRKRVSVLEEKVERLEKYVEDKKEESNTATVEVSEKKDKSTDDRNKSEKKIDISDKRERSKVTIETHKKRISWQEAIERIQRQFESERGTYCDLFVKCVLAEYGFDEFEGLRIPSIYRYLQSNWVRLSAKEAAKRAEKGIPTVALTTNSEPPGNHIVVLTGGIDNKNRPRVKSAGAFSGPYGTPHQKRPGRKYLGYIYEDIGYHWKRRHFKYIKYFSQF